MLDIYWSHECVYQASNFLVVLLVALANIYIYIFDRLRSEYGLKSASTPQIGIHCRHYLKSRSDLRVFSNRCPFQILRSMADLLVMVRAYVSDVIGPRFEKVRNGHRFENWTPIWEYEKGHIFENSKKGLRSEVCVSDVEKYIYGSSIHM